jgi:hypothetical protein
MRIFKKEIVIRPKLNLLPVITILGLLIFVINLQNVLRNYFAIYGTNDDYLINSFLDGRYSGTNEYHLTFINEILSFVLAEFYKLFPNVPVYGIFLVLILVISLIGPIILQIKKNNNYSTKLIISWLISSIFITNWFVLNPTYTSASIMISSFGYLIVFNLVNNKFSKKMFYAAIILLVMGYLLRVQGFQSSSLIWLPLILASLGYQTVNKKINYKIFINTSTILASIIPIFIITFVNLNIDSEWKDFYELNKKRGSIETTTRISYLEANKAKLNIEDDLLTGLQNFTIIDQTNLKIEVLDELMIKSNSSQSVSGLINPAVDVVSRVQSLYKYGGLIALMLLLPLATTLINTRNRVYYFHLGLISSSLLFSFYFLLSTAKIEERVIIPLALNLWFFAFAFLGGKQIKSDSKSLILYLIFTLIFLSIFNEHVHDPTYFKERSKWNRGAIDFSNQQRTALSEVGDNPIFVGPITAIRLNWASPYEVSQVKDPNFISFGWHNFSPTWYEKNKRLFKNDYSIFENLINNNQTYLVSDPEIADSFFSSKYWPDSLEFNPKIVSSIGSVENDYGGIYNIYSLSSK